MRQIILLTSWQCWFCSRLTNWLRMLSPLSLELVNFASCRCQKCLNQESWARSIRFHFEKDVELYGDFFWLLSLILSGALTHSWIVLAHCWLNIVASLSQVLRISSTSMLSSRCRRACAAVDQIHHVCGSQQTTMVHCKGRGAGEGPGRCRLCNW